MTKEYKNSRLTLDEHAKEIADREKTGCKGRRQEYSRWHFSRLTLEEKIALTKYALEEGDEKHIDHRRKQPRKTRATIKMPPLLEVDRR